MLADVKIAFPFTACMTCTASCCWGPPPMHACGLIYSPQKTQFSRVHNNWEMALKVLNRHAAAQLQPTARIAVDDNAWDSVRKAHPFYIYWEHGGSWDATCWTRSRPTSTHCLRLSSGSNPPQTGLVYAEKKYSWMSTMLIKIGSWPRLEVWNQLNVHRREDSRDLMFE